MPQVPQTLTREGTYSEPIPSGGVVRIDPNLRTANGQRLGLDEVDVCGAFLCIHVHDDPNLPEFGTFEAQNISDSDAFLSWSVSSHILFFKKTNAAPQTDLGPNGAFPSAFTPIALTGGGAYTDNLLPRYGNPIPVASFQAALDANKRTVRTLVYRPNLPASTPPAPNTFTDWDDLYAAYQAQANAGACLIKFEQEGTFGPPIQIPAGVWDFTYGDVFSGASLGPPLSVELVDGCQIRNVYLFEEGLGLIGKTTGAPQLVWDQFIGTGAPTIAIFQDAVILRNEGTAPMISWAEDVGAGDLLGIGLGFFSRLEQGTYEIIDLPNVAGLTLCQIFCPAAAFIAPNTLRGSGNAAYQFEINAQGGEINLDQPNFTGLGPLSNPAAHLIRANRRIRFHESQTPLDNGATIDLEPSATALCAPSVDGGAAITINLPRAAFFAGVICGVKKVNGDVSTAVNVIPQGGETINGAGSYSLPVGAYSGAQFFSDGQNWLILNTQTPSLGPQTPDTTGAFAHYPLQDAFGSTTFTDTIGGRTITRTGAGAFIEVPHSIFPSRKLVYVTNAIWESAVDAAWASVGQTVEMLVLPFATGTAPVMRIINGGGQETFRIHWSNGRWQYTHFSQNVLTPLNNPNYSGVGGSRQYPEVYLLRVERDDAIKEVRFYVDGKLWNTIVYGTGLPAGGGEKIQMDVMGVMYSDMTIWNTATPPVSALQQAQRVKPWLF